MRKSVGIIGQGFVGTAIYHGLRGFYSVLTYDIDKTRCNSTLQQIVKECEVIFQCLPTPMKKSGECDISIVRNSLSKVNEVASQIATSRPTVVIKSTVPPGTTEKLNKENAHVDVVFSPEFLTEANHINDFKNQTRIIIGGEGAKKVKQMFRKPFPKIPIVVTKTETAEMVKYFTNCFLATKVTFANEMYDICDKASIDYDKVCEYVLYDQRIGKSHLAVPGPDGDRGFGGHCFPKDLSGMIFLSECMNLEPEVLKTIKNKNDKIRSNRDWEKMPGRAISNEE